MRCGRGARELQLRIFGMHLALRSLGLLGSICCTLLCLTNDVRSELTIEGTVPGSRLVPLFLLAEDGARDFAGWFDKTRGERCTFAVSGDGLLRCLPTDDVVPSDAYSDPGCKEPLALLPRCAAPRLYVLRIEAPTCATSPRHYLHAPGKRSLLPAVYQLAGGTCVKTPRNEELMYVTLGAEIAPASFVAARVATGRTTLAIKTEY